MVLITLSSLTFAFLCLDFLICKVGMIMITEVIIEGLNAIMQIRCPEPLPGTSEWLQKCRLFSFFLLLLTLSPPTVLLGGWKDYVSSRLQASVARELRLFLAALGS